MVVRGPAAFQREGISGNRVNIFREVSEDEPGPVQDQGGPD